MELVFSDDMLPQQVIKSIFLAGPSPRTDDVYDWRNDALEILNELGYTGTVFIPIPRNTFYKKEKNNKWTYYDQIEWECTCRNIADAVLYWIPRTSKLPGLTTNIEFGEDLKSGKIIYGRPSNAMSCRYLDVRAQEQNIKINETLEQTLITTLDFLNEGSLREGKEIYVPLLIWKTPQFQNWYKNLKAAGNKLDYFKVTSVTLVSSKKLVFFFSAKVSVWVEAEQRFKRNESIFSRTDISAIVASYKNPSTGQRFFVLVKEFRSPVNNNEGFIYELPGGSSFKNIDFKQNACDEFREEVGLHIKDLSRFYFVSAKQICATFSTHITHLYRLDLTEEEFNIIEEFSKSQKVLGENDEEKTYVTIVEEEQLEYYNIDFGTLGMIYNSIRTE